MDVGFSVNWCYYLAWKIVIALKSWNIVTLLSRNGFRFLKIYVRYVQSTNGAFSNVECFLALTVLDEMLDEFQLEIKLSPLKFTEITLF